MDPPCQGSNECEPDLSAPSQRFGNLLWVVETTQALYYQTTLLHVYRVLYSIAAGTDIMAAYSPATSQGIGTSHSLHAPSALTAR